MGKEKAKGKNRKKKRGKHEDPEVIFGQCLAALGQGAVLMPVAADGVRYLRRRYLAPIEEFAATWAKYQMSQIAVSREVGRLAAHAAARAGRSEIAARDLQGALGGLDAGLMRICPWS